ncbi:hypothetical protein C0J52_19440 [Blattella germanica]|nr:hypothetical protein C0J52_19440 [Blattella germanica]
MSGTSVVRILLPESHHRPSGVGHIMTSPGSWWKLCWSDVGGVAPLEKSRRWLAHPCWRRACRLDKGGLERRGGRTFKATGTWPSETRLRSVRGGSYQNNFNREEGFQISNA